MHGQQGSQQAATAAVVEVAEGGPVRVDRGVLLDALAALPDARLVVCWPHGEDRGGLPDVLVAAGGLVDDRTAAGTLRPVVDAMKRVVDGTVVQTVDRSTLHRVVAPLVVDVRVARRALEADAADRVAPLDGLPADGRVLPLP